MGKWSDQFTDASSILNVLENICGADAINWNNNPQRYRKQKRSNACLCASLKGLTERWDVGLAALQPPCAPLGLPASLLPPSYAAALEGFVSGWPHYFPLNQPKEGLSQAQWSWLQQGRAVTHLQHSALVLGATMLTLPHSNITYWHIFLQFHTEAFQSVVKTETTPTMGKHVYYCIWKVLDERVHSTLNIIKF